MRTQLFVTLALLSGATVAAAQQYAPVPTTPSPPGVGPGAVVAAGLGGVGNSTPHSVPLGEPVVGVGDSPLIPPVVSEGPAAIGGVRGAPANSGMYWLTGNYLIGWIPKMSLPTPLVTTGLITDTVPGALRQPGTQILYGTKIPFDAFQGFKVDAGLFCSDDRTWSIDGSGFALLGQTTSQSYASDDLGNPILTRPVYNVVAEVEGAVVDALPGLARGSINITADSQMWGFETNTRCHVGSGPLRGDLLLGFRYVRLEENLTIQDRLAPLRDNSLTFLGQFVNAPNSLMDMDHFATQNEFYGGQVGGTIIYEDSWYFVRIMGKVGFGAINQTANIEGSSTLVTPTGNTSAVGGILAQTSNIGNHSRTVFGILPEWGVSGGFYVTQNIRISAGYSLLMWSRVARPGDVIDRGVNPGLIPTAASYGLINGPERPAFRWNDSTFWMQAATAGLEFTF